ncbi:MAG TPA: 50S ribosomal protein L4 [Blattabacteriaceae bacterium]
MEVKVFDITGKETGRKVILQDQVFGINPNTHAISMEIKRYLSAQRQGTHKTKERSEVSGSTRKLHRQKGTGGSRKGDINNPLFRGGGRVFGPIPKKYLFKLNKSFKKLAKRSILSQRLKEGKLKVIENFLLKNPKTKLFLGILSLLNLRKKKVLMVYGKPNKNLFLSSRNLEKIKLATYNEVSSYDLLNASNILFMEDSLEEVHKNLMEV